MRIGQQVTYVKGSSTTRATVAGFKGNGPSGFKRLDLALGKDKSVDEVLHEKDGDGEFWTLDAPEAVAARRKSASGKSAKSKD